MKKILIAVVIILGMSVGLTMPVMAEPAASGGTSSSTSSGGTSSGGNASGSDCVSTSIIGGGQYCDDGSGGGIIHTLEIAIDVLTFGIGTAAILGIVVSGVQYITAADNAGQMQKAKTRIFHIVLGLVIYAVFWGILQFLLPGGLFGDGS